VSERTLQILWAMEQPLLDIGAQISACKHVSNSPAVVERDVWRVLFDKMRELQMQISKQWSEALNEERRARGDAA
jgi:hypothetical protein